MKWITRLIICLMLMNCGEDMPHKYSWHDLAATSAAEIMGFSRFNKIIWRLEALKERFEVDHVWSTGNHKELGAVGFGAVLGNGAYDSDPLTVVPNSDFNLTSVTHEAVGVYRFNWANNITADGMVLATVGNGSAGGGFGSYTTQTDSSAGFTDVRVYNVNGVFTDLSITQMLSVVAKESQTDGVPVFTWQDIDPIFNGQKLGFQTFNKLMNNIDAWFERFAHQHSTANSTHDIPGAVAFGAIKGEGSGNMSLLKGSTYNISKARLYRQSIPNLYSVVFTKSIVGTTTVAVSMGSASGSSDAPNPVFATSFQPGTTKELAFFIADNTGAIQNLESNQILSFAVYQSPTADTPANALVWAAKRIVDSMFGDDTYNQIRTMMLALKERFEHGHFFDTGTHHERGSIAFGTFIGNFGGAPSRVAGTFHNMANTPSRVGTGHYQVDWDYALPLNAVVLATVGGAADSLIAVTNHLGASTDVYIFDEGGNAQDLTNAQYCSVDVMINSNETLAASEEDVRGKRQKFPR